MITEMTAPGSEFQQFLTLIGSVPRELAVHVVLESPRTARPPSRWLQGISRRPTADDVERWFAELTSKWLRRGTHHSVPDLIRSVEMWVASWNENPRPFIWQSADQPCSRM